MIRGKARDERDDDDVPRCADPWILRSLAVGSAHLPSTSRAISDGNSASMVAYGRPAIPRQLHREKRLAGVSRERRRTPIPSKMSTATLLLRLKWQQTFVVHCYQRAPTEFHGREIRACEKFRKENGDASRARLSLRRDSGITELLFPRRMLSAIIIRLRANCNARIERVRAYRSSHSRAHGRLSSRQDSLL